MRKQHHATRFRKKFPVLIYDLFGNKEMERKTKKQKRKELA